MYKFKKDQFQRNRGGKSRVLDISCSNCGAHLCYYQKDGPGVLKRTYKDRFIDIQPITEKLICASCKSELGLNMNYKKENRPAYRLFVGSVTAKSISATRL